MNILHVTAHMGGGVGQALSALVLEETENCHRIICLERPEKMQLINICIACGTRVQIAPLREDILSALIWSDIVVLHWWHHPVMTRFLSGFPSIPIRVILWAHISGCCYPVLPAALLLKAQEIFFTSPYSYENQEWSEEEREQIKKKSCVLYGSGIIHQTDCLDWEGRERSNHTLYNIGYAGTFARSKMHPGFVQACAEILKGLPEAHFLLAGDIESGVWIQREAQALGIQDRIEFTGYLDNMALFWRQIDVFGYPLNPQHFGTTENIILEAMCAGVPVVLLNQAAEKYIVSHLEDGILAESMDDYVEWIIRLQSDKALREALTIQAAKKVGRLYDHKRIVIAFQREVAKLNKMSKRPVYFSDVLGTVPADYISCALPAELRENWIRLKDNQLSPKEKERFFQTIPYILKEHSKSSIPHFARSYPDDLFLKEMELKLDGRQLN